MLTLILGHSLGHRHRYSDLDTQVQNAALAEGKVGAYVVLGASAFIPLLHGVQLYGLRYMLQYSGMRWYLLELVLYGGGVSLYGVSLRPRCPLLHQSERQVS